MALTAIAIGIQSSSYSSFTLSSKNEEESLENMSTRTAMQKRIVEQLLGRTIRKWASQETRSPNAQGQTGENSPRMLRRVLSPVGVQMWSRSRQPLWRFIENPQQRYISSRMGRA